jgi:hypothetical protein
MKIAKQTQKQKTITLPNGQVLTLINTMTQHDDESKTTLEKHVYLDEENGQHIRYFSYPTPSNEPKHDGYHRFTGKVNKKG